jgi:hypothetical protein
MRIHELFGARRPELLVGFTIKVHSAGRSPFGCDLQPRILSCERRQLKDKIGKQICRSYLSLSL